jgi:hypothetical protein
MIWCGQEYAELHNGAGRILRSQGKETAAETKIPFRTAQRWVAPHLESGTRVLLFWLQLRLHQVRLPIV